MVTFESPWIKSVTASPWFQENLWGHRFQIGSNQDIVLLEFLNILESRFNDGCAILLDEHDDGQPATISMRRSLASRFLIFGSKNAEKCLNDNNLNSENLKWEAHIRALSDDYVAHVHESYWPNFDFSYLKERFVDFQEYFQTLTLLSRLNIKVANSPRWTTNFLFPFSQEALFEDVEVSKDKKPNNKRNLFGRSGELVFLMLSRSNKRDELSEAFRSLLFSSTEERNTMRNLLHKIMPPHELAGQALRGERVSIGYLGYDKCKAFDLMAEDILQIFNSGLPGNDIFPHLARIIMFHLQNYFLRIGYQGSLPETYNDGCPVSQKVPYVIEIRSLQRDGVRKLSENCFQMNKAAGLHRIKSELDKVRESEDFLHSLSSTDDDIAVIEYLKKKFNISDDALGTTTRFRGDRDALYDYLSQKIISKYENDLEEIPQTYARWCGLASKKGSRSYRYAPTDEFLRTLVLANVSKRMDLQDFLDLLWEKYGFIITQEQARNFPQIDGSLEDFESNLDRFKTKLIKLGLLRNLSDWCSFVLNRYNEELPEEILA